MSAVSAQHVMTVLGENDIDACVPDGELHYGGHLTGETFAAAAMDGAGRIGGMHVRCEAATRSVCWHTGYPARPVDRHDVTRLCERFGLALPDAYR